MALDKLKFIAGGGLIERRSFLASGFAFVSAGTAVAAPSSAKAGPGVGEGLPSWMTEIGGDDEPYGKPSPYENHIARRPQPTTPETAGFSIWHTPLQNQRGIITPNGLHFSVNHNGVPDIKPDEHQLIIHGLVDRPLKFSVEQLMRYPMTSNIRFLECAGNTAANALSPGPIDASCQDLFGQLSGAEWTGVSLSLLLREAGLDDRASWVIAEGSDGGSHARSIPLAKLLDDAILALFQNGERLRPSQGYPMRLFVPGWEGNVNVKWLHRLEVTDRPAYTKDESGLYAEPLSNGKIEHFTFPMNVKSVITQPSGRLFLPEKRGFYEIAGLAWSGNGTIEKVEVSADEGRTWAPAKLHDPVLDKSLTRFSLPWFWDGKPTTLLSRATDSAGHTQPNRSDWKKRYASHSFNHYNAIQAWRVGRDGEVRNVYH